MDYSNLKKIKTSYFSKLMLSLMFLAFSFQSQLSHASELSPKTLTWAAGGVGGGWYVQAGGIANLVKEKEPNLTIKVVPGGGVVNPMRVSMGKDDLGWGITFIDKMALNGSEPLFRRPSPDVTSLGGVFGMYYIHTVAAADTGITTLQELADMVKAGKSINVAVPMKGTSDLPMIEQILGFYGVSIDMIKDAGGKVIHAVYSDMVSLYKDRHVDYVFTHLSIPGAAVTEMAVSRDTQLLQISEECIASLHDSLGTLSSESGMAVIPAGTYEGQSGGVSTVVSSGELLINKNISDDVAYTIIKIISDNIDALKKENPANKYFVPKDGWKNVAVPLHPGAVRFYKEAGYME
ncbi:TAXI family TRAP transporter solute-binding subunit [Vibrio sp. EA2]|uniref:TAXI family TRAP transporter solute-binding subunit n=1 Tax=Vibrio sp. EA2 TaxID=3079860 RepID=UPI00294A29AF|nr:TAXI family TRAP transporter solute-binding subunit [Vibrio sp. EA2]MDV6250532.1 TAXI family TRAP transporter solute-binding subunit [Vibrio sp. EA2]